MGRTWNVDTEWVQKALQPLKGLGLGATLAYPGMFPAGFSAIGIGPREHPRNEYLGLIATRPDHDTIVFGLNYFDTHDNCDNEDMYRLSLSSGAVTPYMGRSFEAEYPQYAGHHRAAKPFLRKASEIL